MSVIIRFHDPNRLALLEEAIFSLALQFWRDIELVVVIQNGTAAIEAQIAELIEKQPWLGQPLYKVLSLQFSPGFDGRSKLLNYGVQHAKGRYLAFLDDDDYVYQHGYRVLIESLNGNQQVLAAGKCRVSRSRKSNGHWHIYQKNSPFEWGRNLADLLFDNFIPIHSYVIDRTRIAPEDLWFDEQLNLLEDYDFLLRLVAKYRFDFSNLDNPVCEYRYHETNSLQPDLGLNPASTPKILQARELIDARKNSLIISLTVLDLLQLRTELQVVVPTPILEPSIDKKLLIDLLTKQNRSLNKVVDKIYDFAHQHTGLISILVFCTRSVRKFLAAFR
ncbi:MAG: glycosyltransferase [Acidobacteriota bacterium]|nr:glycosyltransferase [Acidobacteriota bacterium]